MTQFRGCAWRRVAAQSEAQLFFRCGAGQCNAGRRSAKHSTVPYIFSLRGLAGRRSAPRGMAQHSTVPYIFSVRRTAGRRAALQSKAQFLYFFDAAQGGSMLRAAALGNAGRGFAGRCLAQHSTAQVPYIFSARGEASRGQAPQSEAQLFFRCGAGQGDARRRTAWHSTAQFSTTEINL